jgi:hypothetical protein
VRFRLEVKSAARDGFFRVEFNSERPAFPSPAEFPMIRVASCLLVLSALLAGGCTPPRVSGPEVDSSAVERLRAVLVSAPTTEDVAGETAETGTGWASLKGRFVFAGTPGDPRPLVVDKDTEVCARGGMKLLDRSLLVDASTKGLANVVVFARKASRVKEPVSTEPVVFDQKDCEFLSPVFASRVGRPVDVRNSDPIGHNTNIAGTAFNQLIPATASTVYTPDRELGLPTMVTCNIHPWMKAYAIFRKDGYVAVSAADGTFEIPDLPAGEVIEFQVWHERSTGPSGAVGLDQPALKWNPRGRFEVRLEEGEVRDLGTLEVPAGAIGG